MQDLLAVVDGLNRDNNVDGILIQLPLPPHVDTKRILEAVDPAKDVDGFHPVNLGRLVSGRPGLVACTPAGCMEILRRSNISIEGANEHQLVCIGMLAHRANFADNDTADAGADADHLVDFEPEHRQFRRHRLRVVVDRREFAKPGKGNPHQTWNPARKRWSFS